MTTVARKQTGCVAGVTGVTGVMGVTGVTGPGGTGGEVNVICNAVEVILREQ